MRKGARLGAVSIAKGVRKTQGRAAHGERMKKFLSICINGCFLNETTRAASAKTGRRVESVGQGLDGMKM